MTVPSTEPRSFSSDATDGSTFFYGLTAWNRELNPMASELCNNAMQPFQRHEFTK